MDLPYVIRRSRRQFPQSTAVRVLAGSATLDEVIDRAERFANGLDAIGIPAGAAIGVLSENRSEYPEVDLGIVLGRRVRVALNSRLHLQDFRYSLADSDARALVHSAAFAEVAHALAAELGLTLICLDELDGLDGVTYQALLRRADPTPVARPGSAEDAAWISYTSGTTGRPKGVVLSHRAVREVAFNLMLELGPPRAREMIVLTQPLSHGAGYFVLPQLLCGGGVYVMSRFDAEEAMRVGVRDDTRTLKVVPAMFPDLFRAHDALGTLGFDTIVYGASPIPGPILDEALERFGPVLIQIYGQTEAPVTLTCLHKDDHLIDGEQRRSAGRPWRSVAVDIVDPEGAVLGPGEVGEITVVGKHMMSGYLGLEDATAKVVRDNRIWTRDMGMIDEYGYVHLLGRSDEMINSGGFNIAPREVEMAMQEHPAVAECAVMGLPDPRWGQAVHAAVTLRQEATASIEDLFSFGRGRLTMRAPKRIVVLEEIPRNAYGKIDRLQLTSLLSADDAQQVT